MFLDKEPLLLCMALKRVYKNFFAPAILGSRNKYTLI